MRFLLIDRITSWHPGERAEAVKTISLSEDYFEEHYPNLPIMPGSLIIEGLAQLGGLLVEEDVRAGSGRPVKAMLTIIEKAKFRLTAHPGDRLVYQAEVLSVNELGGRLECRALRDGEVAVDARLVVGFKEIEDPVLEEKRRTVMDFWFGGCAEDA